MDPHGITETILNYLSIFGQKSMAELDALADDVRRELKARLRVPAYETVMPLHDTSILVHLVSFSVPFDATAVINAATAETTVIVYTGKARAQRATKLHSTSVRDIVQAICAPLEDDVKEGWWLSTLHGK